MNANLPTSNPARWFVPPSGLRPVLWCLPYAGGGASVFRGWDEALSPWVDVRPIFLPGREVRFNEPAVDDLAVLARRLCELTRPWNHVPQAWFGHSMGAALAFEAAVRVQQDDGRQPPLLLAVGGRAAPGLGRVRAPVHHLPAPDFIAQLSRMGGTPQAVLENDELMELLLPLMRADFKAIETWRASAVKLPLTELLIFGGADDPETTPERMAAWREFCEEPRLNLVRMPGGHFFINTHRAELLESLRQHLQRILGA